ncbi:ketoacyl-ACP synthase III [Clostridium botulinum D/C]|uniref:ketoacyl-ACP synthase III n=1 Tax=Clostridium botulinum TaxID=1491 RepID=UPI001E5FF810|nr:ketoacyl-ACP synthase III [Clostridium botulinum]MCD3351868.1 ketoacyl-ACP synthase III [Clostridium botulinum D/C]MCD3359083.1 ketoacyl-ACP synthase III [Clostridium botulinum D/C]MCD3363756.1 ketoacyl-ACP synthase III [Clostridium botulinum D/C]MCD3364670.1 ketoacyl-ACP synthase III [Clostridium botulinum D/C]
MINQKNRNVLIKSIGSYHPTKILNNEFYLSHFKKRSKKLETEAKEYFKELGRKERCIAEEDENSLTMSIESCKLALEKANLQIKDIDIIISATDLPEYLTPACAIMINEALQGNAKVAFDVNCDCISMLHGVDVATKFLKCDKKYKYALVVGSFLINRFSREDDIITFATSGDNACAIILEVKEEIEERGYLGSVTLTDSYYSKYFRHPRCGLSKIYDLNIPVYDKLLQWDHFNCDFLAPNWAKIITEVLAEKELNPSDVSHFFMSQFSIEELRKTMDILNVSHDKFNFIADKYGYTGPSSPFLAFHEEIKNRNFTEGDINIFCSVGGGYSMTALLYKW